MTLQVYHGLLSFTVHAKPKVRLPGHQSMGRDLPLQEAGCGWPCQSEEDGQLAWSPGLLP